MKTLIEVTRGVGDRLLELVMPRADAAAIAPCVEPNMAACGTECEPCDSTYHAWCHCCTREDGCVFCGPWYQLAC